MKPTYVSLFTGIGGIDLGLNRAGWRSVGMVEKDPQCQAFLRTKFKGVPLHDDIRTYDPTGKARTADLVAGGFPCQPYSTIGKQDGETDPRNLWPETIRVVRIIRPPWFMGENVIGSRRIVGDTIKRDLEEAGYTLWPLLLDATAVRAPQSRQRLVYLAARREVGDAFGLRWQGWVPPTEPQKKRHRVSAAPSTLHAWPPGPAQVREIPVCPDGLPSRLARRVRMFGVRATGNAVVPPLFEMIGRVILQAHAIAGDCRQTKMFAPPADGPLPKSQV